MTLNFWNENGNYVHLTVQENTDGVALIGDDGQDYKLSVDDEGKILIVDRNNGRAVWHRLENFFKGD